MSCGSNHVIIVDSEHKAYTWGNNAFGQLGQGDFKDLEKPIEIDYHMDVVLAEAYGNSTAIVDNLNNLLTFGSNSHG